MHTSAIRGVAARVAAGAGTPIHLARRGGVDSGLRCPCRGRDPRQRAGEGGAGGLPRTVRERLRRRPAAATALHGAHGWGRDHGRDRGPRCRAPSLARCGL